MIDTWYSWDWVNQGRDKLVITVGESWTWGDSLGKTQHKIYDDRAFRLKNVYGAKLAELLDADFINIAEPGQSNLWIADKICWVRNNVHELNYKKIYYIATLTEVGREFNGDRDHNRVYTELLKDVKTFDDFLFVLSQEIANVLKLYPDVVLGTNFVDSNYPTWLSVLPRSWLDLIAEHNKQSITDSCTVVQSWVFDRFDAVFEFNPRIDRLQWLRDVLEHMKRASQRTDLMLRSPLNYKKASKHPTPEGHLLWANYLYDQIIKSPQSE